MTDLHKIVENHVLELLDAYIDIQVEDFKDEYPPEKLAENAIAHYAEFEHIL